jgi:hypothetical protein
MVGLRDGEGGFKGCYYGKAKKQNDKKADSWNGSDVKY